MDGVPAHRSIRVTWPCNCACMRACFVMSATDSAGFERVSVETTLQLFTFCKRTAGSHFGVLDCIISEYNGLTSLSRLKTCNEPAFFRTLHLLSKKGRLRASGHL
jgi:hypothetical protein